MINNGLMSFRIWHLSIQIDLEAYLQTTMHNMYMYMHMYIHSMLSLLESYIYNNNVISMMLSRGVATLLWYASKLDSRVLESHTTLIMSPLD